MSDRARTVRAAAVAGILAFAMIAGLGLFLLPGSTTGSVVAGLVAAVLAVALLLGAAQRSERLSDPTTPPEDHRG